MVDLNKEIKYIKGVGPNRAQLLNKLGIFTLGDLITFYPREHEDRGKAKNIIDLQNGEEALISAFPVGRISIVQIRKNLTLCKLVVRDETAACQIVWYNQGYLKNVFNTNERYNFYGKVNAGFGWFEMQSRVEEVSGINSATGRVI